MVLGSNCPVGGGIVRDAIVLGVNCPRCQLSEGQLSGEKFPGSSCAGGIVMFPVLRLFGGY